MPDEDGFKLTKTQMIALTTCQKELAEAQQQLKIVQQETGLDLTKQYQITPEGVVHEIIGKPKVEAGKKEA